MDKVISKELQIYGSHGMQAAKYDGMLKMIVSGKLDPGLIIGKTVPLGGAPKELKKMSRYDTLGIVVIDRF